MGLAWNICAPLGTLSTFFFNPVFRLSTAKNEINLFNYHVLIVAPVTFAPAGAMTPSAEFLFLFEVLKMGKLTRGPLVLYLRPKYWSRKPVIKNNFRILKTTHAYFQTILKAPVKFQKDQLKTVVGVTGTRYLLPIRFCSIRTQKMYKLKMRKK